MTSPRHGPDSAAPRPPRGRGTGGTPHPHLILDCTAALLLGLLPGCGTPTACADILRVWTVTVIDDAGSPVADATVTSVLARTGDTLSSTSGPSPMGFYRIIGDDDIDKFHGAEKFRPADDTVLVTAETVSGARAAATLHFFRTLCGLGKSSGPDTLVVQ